MTKQWLKYEPQLFHYIKYRLNYDEEDAKDMLMDTYVKAKKKFDAGGYKEEGKFKTWIFTIATNLWRDYVRSLYRKSRYVDFYQGTEYSHINQIVDIEFNPEELIDEEEQKQVILAAIDMIPKDQGIVIRKIYINGMRYIDLAEELELSINTVLGQARYGKKNLKKVLSIN